MLHQYKQYASSPAAELDSRLRRSLELGETLNIIMNNLKTNLSGVYLKIAGLAGLGNVENFGVDHGKMMEELQKESAGIQHLIDTLGHDINRNFVTSKLVELLIEQAKEGSIDVDANPDVADLFEKLKRK